MSVDYRAISWNPFKKRFDIVFVAGLGIAILAFVGFSFLTANPGSVPRLEAVVIRALGTVTIFMLHAVLWIGPLARLHRRFLPALYNRRHMGVATFFLALLLASRPPRLAAKALLGIALLWALAAFGVACEVAISLGNIAGPSGPLVHFNAFAATFAALGFQLGTLIFPTVVPAMLWVAMDPRYMRAAARRMGVDGKSA